MRSMILTSALMIGSCFAIKPGYPYPPNNTHNHGASVVKPYIIKNQ